MWAGLLFVFLTLLLVLTGARSIRRDFTERRWAWVGLGILATVAGTAALALLTIMLGVDAGGG